MNRRAASAVVVAVIGAVVLALAAMKGFGSSLPQSPEALFERICEHQLAGDTGRIWDLLTDDARAEQIRGFDAHRWLLKNNDDPNETLTRNNYHVTRAEFLRMSNVEIYCAENKGRERVLVGSKITNKQVDPRSSDDVYVTIETPGRVEIMMHARHVDGGWRLVDNRVRQLK